MRRLDAPLPRERHEILKMSIATVRGDSPCGCPLSAKPIQRFKQADKPRFLNFCKVKASDSTNIYNQASNSRAAVFDKPTKRGEGTACAASRTSTHPFKLRRVCVRMCRATNGEPRAKYCGAAFAGSRGAALSLLFFCRRFLFQIKRKCRNAVSIKYSIMVGREGRSQL